MKSLSVVELSKLYGINRQTIYNHINKGILSKNSDNKIDLSEAIRVFGEPPKKQNVKETVKVDSQNSTENLLLRQQIDMLKNQLEDAKEREAFYQNQIEAMQRLLEAPKNNMTTFTEQKPDPDIATNPRPEHEPKDDGLITPVETKNKRISMLEHAKPEQPKRGWLSRFFLPNG
ncbi:plasmid replication DNA-binding protein [Acinetobacter baumannii]|uniref:plasmid replication DNA-binding protein n=1 Tax=Acinetobacter baumannii TaxID=470 RepID=UPI0023422000|nr:plasmid replication DNA-binding protein [Acinetobacter baumannii]MDC4797846.1 helix-turn-helix domain-containing protein [Acinetobacter baumannii]MDK2104776.1 plasmid replication DNA-binding protein [Acinetobacter baumannii]MDK2150497.1 plasmid replication DNA-binding protein [Acinetobacter baumannii]MDK2180145.1 plasmid replication DNA-binding protein [Acinetobacter baumannii]MDK2198454.1 plasmid replication DNA-binding protein [Acinetobacter baumannii]